MIDKSKSLYDQSRDTVGKMYRDLQVNSKPDDIILVGDMSNELMKDLVVDTNEALEAYSKKAMKSKAEGGNDGNPFYLMIHEKKDLQMKKALLRRMLYFSYRPWPEDDTTVYKKDPKTNELWFCWSLPHWSEMDNFLMNQNMYDRELIFQIKMWKKYNMKAFGFYHHPELKWVPNPKWTDRRVPQKD